ncbi:MAG: hypothetical protein AAF667_02575 [Pseudomonadota bacterium]
MLQRFYHRISRNRVAIAGLACGMAFTLMLGLLGQVVFTGEPLGYSPQPHSDSFNL